MKTTNQTRRPGRTLDANPYLRDYHVLHQGGNLEAGCAAGLSDVRSTGLAAAQGCQPFAVWVAGRTRGTRPVVVRCYGHCNPTCLSAPWDTLISSYSGSGSRAVHIWWAPILSRCVRACAGNEDVKHRMWMPSCSWYFGNGAAVLVLSSRCTRPIREPCHMLLRYVCPFPPSPTSALRSGGKSGLGISNCWKHPGFNPEQRP